MKKDDVNIEFVGNELIVTGESRSANERPSDTRRAYRALRLLGRPPGHVDSEKIDASLSDGVLTVRVPKSEHAQRRKIEIKK